ncbi:hypothetical protein SAMN05216167_10339 [Spirosoma endophyticum]|uniref:Uncharacterized protein n=1 Tax=Spirosoma endophyticum TaxID=662367 RepID=A0A1I1NYS9_9BACT|nr:hypothetical protein SAMN05216167_10339 [Spirosoma endophyticum]
MFCKEALEVSKIVRKLIFKDLLILILISIVLYSPGETHVEGF